MTRWHAFLYGLACVESQVTRSLITCLLGIDLVYSVSQDQTVCLEVRQSVPCEPCPAYLQHCVCRTLCIWASRASLQMFQMLHPG